MDLIGILMEDYRDHFNAAKAEDLRGLPGTKGARSYADYILTRVSPPQGARILDFGCGDGLVLRMIMEARPDLTGIGIDIAEKLIAHANIHHARPGVIDFYTVSCLKEPFSSLGQFDSIFSFSVAQYLQPTALLENTRILASLLKAGGMISHLSIPDLSKRLLLFQDHYLNQSGHDNTLDFFQLGRLLLMEIKRRSIGDYTYGNSRFHCARKLSGIFSKEFFATSHRPSDSWYRFDLLLFPRT